jgi:hypothetical protein
LQTTEDQYAKAKADSFWSSAQQITQQQVKTQSENQSEASQEK